MSHLVVFYVLFISCLLFERIICLNGFFRIIYFSFQFSVVMVEEVDEADDDDDDHRRRIVRLVVALSVIREDPVPENTCPFSGKEYLNWLMNSASDKAFYIVARMHKEISFIPLVNLLRLHGGLSDSRKVCAQEKVFIFLHLACANTMRSAKARWQHSLDTISSCMHQVIKALLKCRLILFEKVNGAIADEVIHPFISSNPKFSPFFDNCIGATDGSLIPAIIPASEQGPWRDRKGNISQNVLIVANFDLLYTYALCG